MSQMKIHARGRGGQPVCGKAISPGRAMVAANAYLMVPADKRCFRCFERIVVANAEADLAASTDQRYLDGSRE